MSSTGARPTRPWRWLAGLGMSALLADASSAIYQRSADSRDRRDTASRGSTATLSTRRGSSSLTSRGNARRGRKAPRQSAGFMTCATLTRPRYQFAGQGARARGEPAARACQPDRHARRLCARPVGQPAGRHGCVRLAHREGEQRMRSASEVPNGAAIDNGNAVTCGFSVSEGDSNQLPTLVSCPPSSR